MGKKLAPGTHTRVPQSPPGPPATETADANGTTHKGYYFTWDPNQGLYRTRIPPPPATPPGEWVFLEFDEMEGYDEYTSYRQAHDPVWTETGRDYANG